MSKGKKIVIALGGNALGNTPEEQLKLVKKAAKSIVSLVKEGYQVVVTHGNGPQVGMINMALEYSHEEISTPEVPFAECGAMSQGYIGYHLQQAIQQELFKNEISKSCITVVTQVLVDRKDKAFANPTKPIGNFYAKEEAIKLQKENGWVMKEDAGRGYRRVVASPSPVKIIEKGVIRDLLNKGHIVIAGGGGGVPVIKKWNQLHGVDAVIDKDKTSARLAIDIKADVFLILTAIEKVCLGFNTEHEQPIDEMTIEEAKEYIAEKQFKEGSMLPKVEACIEYVKGSKNVAIITSLDKALKALQGKTGTWIV